jgi:hypothetical protein
LSAITIITVFIGGLSIYEVDNYIQGETKNLVDVTCENESTKINKTFESMEKSVKIMESYLMEFFDSEDDVADRELQKKVITSADLMFYDVTKHTSATNAVSYYFRLDPAISDGKTGLFYSKLNGTGEFVSFEPTDLSIYDKSDVEHVGWFWQPFEAQQPVWMKPYYNQNNNVLMISYVIPMYYGETFIGVVGMDFDYMALEKQVQEIIDQDLPITYVDENHISVGGNIQKCNGPRIHVAHTGQVENFHLLPQLIYDPFKPRYLLVGCVGENSEELLKTLDMMRQHPAWD